MLYYSARYKDGESKIPEWGQDVKWFSLDEVYKLIPYPEMKKIIEKINEKPETVWGGALKITYDKVSKKRTGYEIIEDFYELN